MNTMKRQKRKTHYSNSEEEYNQYIGNEVEYYKHNEYSNTEEYDEHNEDSCTEAEYYVYNEYSDSEEEYNYTKTCNLQEHFTCRKNNEEEAEDQTNNAENEDIKIQDLNTSMLLMQHGTIQDLQIFLQIIIKL